MALVLELLDKEKADQLRFRRGFDTFFDKSLILMKLRSAELANYT